MAGAMTAASSDRDTPLERALARLVDEGVLDPALARRIQTERDLQAAGLEPVAAPARGRLPEVLGYLGGALVAVAALGVIGRFWSQLPGPARVGVTFGGAAALTGAGLVIAGAARGGWRGLRAPGETARRRLVGVLVVLAAPLAAATAGQLLRDLGDDRVLAPSAGLALAVCLLADVVASGAVPTLGMFFAGATTLGGAGELLGSVTTLAAVAAVAAAAAAWSGLAPRVSGAPLLAVSLGLLAIVGDGFRAAQYSVSGGAGSSGASAPEWGAHAVAPLGYAVLLAVAAAGVTAYLRGGPWPWIAGAGLACAAFVGAFTGRTLGPVAAFFTAGMVLLVASAVLLARRGHQGAPR